MFVNVVVDHQQEMLGEKCNIQGKVLNQREAINKWYSVYCKNIISKKLGFSIINVGQEKMSAQDINHQRAGKLEPTFDSLGDAKTIIRACHNVIAIYSPFSHEQRNHRGYKVTESYRSFHLLKSRFGQSDLQVGLDMHGPSGVFQELEKIKQ